MAIRILIADHNRGERAQVRRFLQLTDLSCECVEVDNVKDALAACETTHFDCVFVDYLMPGFDTAEGIEVLRTIEPNIAVVLTGRSDEVAAEYRKRGAQDYLRKIDIEVSALQRSVELALERADEQRRAKEHREELDSERADEQRLMGEQREELDNFAYALAHDLKAPLRSIRQVAEGVADDAHAGDPDQVVENCRRIVAATSRMDRLITALYRFTTAETQIDVQTVDMEHVLHGTLANLEQSVAKHGAMLPIRLFRL
jgi:CheY-like chemotaxis protein